MDDQTKNLILASVLSLLVIIGWYTFFPPPEPVTPEATGPVAEQTATPTAPEAEGGNEAASNASAAETAVSDAPRVDIETPELTGTLSLQGGRLDELWLSDYRETIDADSANVELFQPVGSDQPYFAFFGWAPADGLTAEQVPGSNTLWTVSEGEKLTPETPITLTWDNGAGLIFTRKISVDDKFMFAIEQSVTNNSGNAVSAAPYGVLSHYGIPKDIKKFFILHEGVIAMADGELTETTYSDAEDFSVDENEGAQAEVERIEENGWIGFTEHYWMSVLIPNPGAAFKSVAKYDPNRDVYVTEAVQNKQTIAPGQTVTAASQLFAGAKEWETIRNYQKEDNVDRFLDTIDWGWFFFLTKPIFWLLHHIHAIIGNMGWSIVALTFSLKLILLPLAFKSYVSMARMKELQPEMEKLKKAAGDDRQQLQKDMMALYKKEKVNPASGCLPMLLQIPIFFSLYKVIFVTLELRHAPWIGWIKDLSAPDPSSLFNLFGLLPWAAPENGGVLAMIFIGLMPIALGISMWLQQKLNPAPADPTQQMIFAWMPWVFMFMLGGFASGLVLYWITNNTLTFTQQYLIMRSQGYKPDVFGNIKSGFQRKDKAKEAKAGATKEKK